MFQQRSTITTPIGFFVVGVAMSYGAASLEAQCTGCSSPPASWQTSGNCACAGQHVLGTTNAVDLDIKVNNARAFRLEHRTGSFPYPNIIGGHSNNAINQSAYAAVIGGGDGNSITINGIWGSLFLGGGVTTPLTLPTVRSVAGLITLSVTRRASSAAGRTTTHLVVTPWS
jgi:hypothetical protein